MIWHANLKGLKALQSIYVNLCLRFISLVSSLWTQYTIIELMKICFDNNYILCSTHFSDIVYYSSGKDYSYIS